MTERPILRLPDAKSDQRQRGRPASFPRPQSAGRAVQSERFRHEFDRLEAAFASEHNVLELRQDPAGIAPERALVFVTVVPISDFVRVARLVGLEVIGEFELDNEYELPDGLIVENPNAVRPTLYATLPTLETLEILLRLWRAYQHGTEAETGYAPWWQLFNMLSELRTWGPRDRLSPDSLTTIEDRLLLNDDEEVRIELEIWPTRDGVKRNRWRRESEARIAAIGGRIIDRSSIIEDGFVYEALLVGLSAATLRAFLQNPSAPEGLATLDGL